MPPGASVIDVGESEAVTLEGNTDVLLRLNCADAHELESLSVRVTVYVVPEPGAPEAVAGAMTSVGALGAHTPGMVIERVALLAV